VESTSVGNATIFEVLPRYFFISTFDATFKLDLFGPTEQPSPTSSDKTPSILNGLLFWLDAVRKL